MTELFLESTSSFDNHTVTISSAFEQMSKGQDYVCNGKGVDSHTGEEFEWALLNDGHGTNTCIQFIRSIPIEKKSELMGTLEPIHAFAKHIDDSRKIHPWDSTGATVLITKCYKDRIVCLSSGDSQFMVFKDGDLIHISKEHNTSNQEERQRIIEKGYKIEPSSAFKLLSESTMTSASAEYIIFPNDQRKLACTQALGHNSRTGYFPEKIVIPLEGGSSYRIVMGSDGIFDMTMLENKEDIQFLQTKSSQEICNKSTNRWLQEWVGHMPDGSIEKFKWDKINCDDISVIVIDAVPK